MFTDLELLDRQTQQVLRALLIALAKLQPVLEASDSQGAGDPFLETIFLSAF